MSEIKTTTIPGLAFQLSLSAMVCISAFSIDVSLPAIPLIKDNYQLIDGYAQLVVGVYLLGFSLGQIPAGLFSDRYGRRPVLIFGLLSFIFFSALCLVAETIDELLFVRFMQGLVGAVGAVLSRAIARDVSAGEGLARLMSLLVTSLAISTLLAPVIGSWLVGLFGWRAPFASSLLLGIILLILMLLFIPESKVSTHSEESVIGQFFSGVKLFFSTRDCVVGTLLISFLFFGYMSFVASFTSILVDVYAIPVVYLGLVFAFPVLAYLFGSWLSRRVMFRSGVNQTVKLSIMLLAVELFLLIFILLSDQILLISLCILLLPFFLVMGLLQPSASMLALSPMGDLAGVASSVLGTMQILSGSLGAFLAASLYQETIDSMVVIILMAVIGLLAVYYLGYKKLNENVVKENV